jgi:hypothetical protein
VWSEITLHWLLAVSATELGRYTLPGSQFCLVEHIALQVLMPLNAISRHLLPKCMQELACIGLVAAGEVASFCDTAGESIERRGKSCASNIQFCMIDERVFVWYCFVIKMHSIQHRSLLYKRTTTAAGGQQIAYVVASISVAIYVGDDTPTAVPLGTTGS